MNLFLKWLTVLLMFYLFSSCGNNTDFTNPKEVAKDAFKLIITGEPNKVYDQYISDTSKSLFTKEEFKKVYGYSDTTLDKKTFKMADISKIVIDPTLQKYRRYQVKFLMINNKKKDTSKKYLYQSLLKDGKKWNLLYNFPLKKTGMNEFREQNYDQAIKAYKEALKYNPIDGDTYLKLGACYSLKRNNNYTKDNAKKAISLSPKKHEAHNLLASAYSNEGKEEVALKKYQEALDLCNEEEDKTYIYGNMINSHLELENLNKAKELSNKLLNIDSTNTTAWWRKGQVYDKQNQLDTALKFYHKAVQCDPLKDYLQGALYFDYSKALKDKAASINSDKEEQVKLFKDAKEYAVEAYSLKPENERYENLLDDIKYKLSIYQ